MSLLQLGKSGCPPLDNSFKNGYTMYMIMYAWGVFIVPIINATTARNNFFKLMEEVLTTNEPIYITGKNGNVVVLSEEDYRSMQETFYLCTIPGMREKIIEGLATPLDECVEDIDE